ncbi:hypothetical protein SAMN05216224_11736 [Thioclava dalianensis]|nr:hypothetical protein SAMN05216224_11736 [Thioclava dalianensis]
MSDAPRGIFVSGEDWEMRFLIHGVLAGTRLRL